MFFTGLSNGCALWRHLSMTTKSASSPRNPILKQRIATMSAARSHPFPLHVVHELQNPKSGIFVAKQTKCPFPLIQNRYRSHSQSFLRLDRCWVQKKRKPKRFFFSTWPWNFDARHPKRMLPKKIILRALEVWLTICTFDWPRGDSNILPWTYKIPLYSYTSVLYGPCKSINCKNSAKWIMS